MAARVRAFDAQAEVLLALEADVVCLQEVTRTTRPLWRTALEGAGLECASPAAHPRRLEVMIAAREGIEAVLSSPAGLPWRERHLAVRTGGVEVHSLHAPTSQREDLVKVRTLEALGAALLAGDGPRVLAGDLNTPRSESPEGEVVTFARTRSGRLRGGRVEIGERHDAAELLLLRGLPGWSDAFRAVHGHARRDRSWRAPWGESYRLDHVVCSPELTATACDYLHPWREDGLSDHAGMWAEIVPVR